MRFGIETYDDKLIESLSKIKGECLYKLKVGICSKKNCARCPYKRKFDNAYMGWSDADKLIIDYSASEYYNKLCHINETYDTMSVSKFIRTILKYISLVAIVFVFIFFITYIHIIKLKPKDTLFNSFSEHQPVYLFDESYCEYIMNCISKSHECICDIDNDCKVDCCDYSILFKLTWDVNGRDPNNCRLVWQRQEKFNHLFVMVRRTKYDPWDCIEPQAECVYNLDMHHAWGDLYDEDYNDYRLEITDYFMGSVYD